MNAITLFGIQGRSRPDHPRPHYGNPAGGRMKQRPLQRRTYSGMLKDTKGWAEGERFIGEEKELYTFTHSHVQYMQHTFTCVYSIDIIPSSPPLEVCL